MEALRIHVQLSFESNLPRRRICQICNPYLANTPKPLWCLNQTLPICWYGSFFWSCPVLRQLTTEPNVKLCLPKSHNISQYKPIGTATHVLTIQTQGLQQNVTRFDIFYWECIEQPRTPKTLPFRQQAAQPIGGSVHDPSPLKVGAQPGDHLLWKHRRALCDFEADHVEPRGREKKKGQ